VKNMKRVSKGFTLIELMIVIAIIAILLALAIPAYQDYTIRSKVGEGLSVGASAKLAAGETCQSDPTLLALTNALVGYEFSASKYVSNAQVTGACTAPILTITTTNTGATAVGATDPVLQLTGATNTGSVDWGCTTVTGEPRHVPSTCRS
jgi:prepilin-type N-terminal cleavage/methylation domain-containing protein